MTARTVSGQFVSGQLATRQLTRFNEKYWNADGPVSTRIGLVSAPGTITCYAELQKFSDLVGLIWKSDDTDSHPLTKYASNSDYSGITWSFTYQTSANFTAFEDPFSEPVLTINYYNGMVLYVSLVAYAAPGYTDHSANVTLNFDTIKAGSFYLPGGPGHGGGDLVPTTGIKSLEFSVFPQYYSPTNFSPINTGAYTAGDSIWVKISNMSVTSNAGGSTPNQFMTVGSYRSAPIPGHGIANDFDSTYNVTPQRLVDDWVSLGFTSVDHYVGTRFSSLHYDSGSSRFIINNSKSTNTAFNAFHTDLAARLIAAAIPFTFAMSFEIYGQDIPSGWDQQDWNNNSAETGYANYTVYARFNNSTVSAYLKSCFAALVGLVPATSLFTAQLGEYAWWAGTDNGPSQVTIGPCIFDFDTRVAYNTATGLFAPEIDAPIVAYSSLSSAQKAYVDWCRGSLGAFADSMAAAIRTARAGTNVSFLFYNDAISDTASSSNGFMQQLNIPYEHWDATTGTYQLAEGEMYGNTTPTFIPADLTDLYQKLAYASPNPNLGYAPGNIRFYTGLATDPSASVNQPANFNPMLTAANAAITMGFGSVIWWAWTQFVQEGFYLLGTTPLSISQITSGVPDLTPPSLPTKGQTRTFTLQVFRSGHWVNIPVMQMSGDVKRGQAGTYTATINDNPKDKYRSQLYEGEKVRAFRGVLGQTSLRCFTGYVDAPTATDKGEISRSVSMTDYLQELNTAILLQGMIFDNTDPMSACAQVIQHAIDTGQFTPTDDSGTALSGTSGFASSSGSPICFFPELLNPDGSPFILASGQLGSYTSGPYAFASLMVPLASVTASTIVPYITYTLPNQYLIASMTQLLSFPFATTSSLPPPSGNAVCDFFNGILYFNPADQGKTLFASSTFFQAPIWAYAPGTRLLDIISEIMDKSGCLWGVDANGKFYSQSVTQPVAPTRILNRSEYIEASIQINRDRSNVILCEGWDSTLQQLIVSKAINFTDINSAPPAGLGKRQYAIIQDQSWRTQAVTNAAAYYAIQQIGKRGKIISVDMIDDPSLTNRSVVGFMGVLPETAAGDFFQIDNVRWNYENKEGAMTARMSVSGHLLPGQSLFYVGPISTVSPVTGAFNLTTDATPIASCSLSPAGGRYYSTFSLAAGLTLNWSEPGSYTAYDFFHDIIALHGEGQVTIYGADGSTHGPYTLTSSYVGGGSVSWPVPLTGLVSGVLYVIVLQYTDPYGNTGYYRDFITALP